MQLSLKHWPLLVLGIAVAAGVACSGENPDDSTEPQVLVGDKGFLMVGIGTDVDDVYPAGLDPSCVPPGPGSPAIGAPLPSSPPVPDYLPEGFALKDEGHTSDGRHFSDSYASASNSYRFTVYAWTCSRFSIPGEAHWEQVTVAGHWGILFDGACSEGSDGGCDWDPNLARTLWFETAQGYVVEMRSPVNPLDKDELLKIAESMPISDS